MGEEGERDRAWDVAHLSAAAGGWPLLLPAFPMWGVRRGAPGGTLRWPKRASRCYNTKCQDTAVDRRERGHIPQ